jgi:hypothetical protein
MQGRFQDLWNHTINRQYIREVYFDVGKETCPVAPVSGSTQTLLWKRCCLDKLRYSQLARNSGQTVFYPLSFLRDTGSLTVETKKGTHVHDDGLRYSQFYNSKKEVFAAGNHYPFSNPLLEVLALDQEIYRTWQHLGKGNHDWNTLYRAYIHSKTRCATAIHGSISKSFGIRKEHRVREDLLVEVDQEIRRHGAAYHLFDNLPSHPFYVHSTRTILNWVRWNMNRLCAGFELTYSLQAGSPVPWSHSQVMLLFLRCLRRAFGGGGNQLELSRACWYDTKQFPGPSGQIQHREGIRLGITIYCYGYGWFLNKINWSAMGFRPAHHPYMDLHTLIVLARFQVNYKHIHSYQDDILLLEDCFLLLAQQQQEPGRLFALLSLMVDICLRAFRKDVLAIMRPVIQPEF